MAAGEQGLPVLVDVLRSRHQFHILHSVIELVAIDVMDEHPRGDWPIGLLPDMTVGCNANPRNHDEPIAQRFADCSASTYCPFTVH